MTRFARRQGASDPEAVVNTALFDAVRNLHNFRGDDRRAFRSYLYQITRRRVADEFRRHNRQPKTVGELNPESTDLVDLGASTFDDRVVDGQLIDEFLGRLTEEQREILEMRVMTGLSIRETADRTGRSEMAVKAMQRRALLSLRTIVLAAAVLLIAFLGVRALTGLGDGGVVVVENGPAGSGGADAEGDEQGLASGVGESAEAPAPLVVEAGPGEDAEGETVAVEAGEDGGAEDSGASSDGGESSGGDGDGPTTAAGNEEGGSAAGDGSDADDSERTNDSQQRPASGTTVTTAVPTTTVASNPAPTTPCNVFHDGTPTAGEVAFVDYDFSGPYTFLKGTTVSLVGSGTGDPILDGYGNQAKVADGTRFPFVIGQHMINEGKLEVSSQLAGGQLTAVCRTASQRVKRPCSVFHDGSPAIGEEAEVAYRVIGPYDTFKDEPTYVIGLRDRSAMVEDDPNLSQAGRHRFTIDRTMMVDGTLTVRTAFADGKAEATCWVTPVE